MSYWETFLQPSEFTFSAYYTEPLSYAAYGMVVKEGDDPDNPSEETKQKVAKELRPLAEELAQKK